MESNSQIPSVAVNVPLVGPGSLLKNAWGMFIDHWKLLAGIAAVPAVIKAIGFLFAVTGISFLVAMLMSLVSTVFVVAMYPALVDAIHRISSDTAENTTLKGQFKFGFSMFWSFLGLLIIEGLSVGGAFVLLIVPGIIVGTYVCLYAFTRVIDGQRGFAALTESYALIGDRWWAVFGRLLVVGVVLGVGAVIISAIFSAFGVFGSVLANMLISITILPIAVIAAHQLYMDLKRTRESGIQTATFKKWLIAFLVVGVLAVAALPFVGLAVISALNLQVQRAPDGSLIPVQH